MKRLRLRAVRAANEPAKYKLLWKRNTDEISITVFIFTFQSKSDYFFRLSSYL